MKWKVTWIGIAIVSLGLLVTAVTAVDRSTPPEGVFIHVSHGQDDPHRVLMALNMASVMCEDRDVLMYFDIQGVGAVLKDAEDITYSHFPSLKQQLATLPGKGVTLLACPGCLKAAGKGPADLALGVEVAAKNKFFDFTKGRILTLDY